MLGQFSRISPGYSSLGQIF